jgi:thiamine kinase-like enzyme
VDRTPGDLHRDARAGPDAAEHRGTGAVRTGAIDQDEPGSGPSAGRPFDRTTARRSPPRSHVRIVDFEDAGQSDLAVELANLVEHIASRDNGNRWTAFLERFPVDPGRLRAARCLFAAFWLTLLRPGGVSADRNPPGTAELQAERVLGLLDSI